MSFARVTKVVLVLLLLVAVAVGGRQGQRYYKKNIAAPRTGEAVYRAECQRCHGPVGQGVAGKADEPLVGEKSPTFLAKYILREMPEDDPGALSAAECAASSPPYIKPETIVIPAAAISVTSCSVACRP